MSTTLAFVDCETTGLYDCHEPWEIAVIRRQPGAATNQRYRWFVQPEHLELADPEALRISRFHERTAGLNTTQGDPWVGRAGRNEWWTEASGLAGCLAELLSGAVLIGCNVQFDARMLRGFLARHGLAPTWHYRPVDVGAMAYGYLCGWWHLADQVGLLENVEGLNRPGRPPWSWTELAKALGIERPVQHEALPDAEFAMAVYDAVTGSAT